MTRTTNRIDEAKDCYYTTVNNAVIATDIYETAQMVANTNISVDIDEEHLQTPFAEATASRGLTIIDVRWYDEDGNLDHSGLEFH